MKDTVKNPKPSRLLDAFFIGFLAGIIIYSLLMNSWGFLTLIPLLMIYGLLKKQRKRNTDTKKLI